MEAGAGHPLIVLRILHLFIEKNKNIPKLSKFSHHIIVYDRVFNNYVSAGHAPYQPAAPLPLGYTSPVRKTAPKPFQGGVRAAKSIGDPSRVKFGN